MNEFPIKKDKKAKCKMVSMRMTLEQYHMIEGLAREIRSSCGYHITKASIMLKLMEYGYARLKTEIIEEKDRHSA